MPLRCSACGTDFLLSDESRELLAKFPDEPMPQLCFTCGHKRRMLFRNGRNLYRRTCDVTGASIVSIYAPEKPYKVYHADAWWGDAWDAKEFGQEIDWSRPFFEQLHELQLQVPRLALTNIKAENSEYCNMTQGNKDCYLIFGGDFNENCLYGTFGMHNRSVMDCDMSNHNERCYGLGDSFHCYDCRFVFDSQHCSGCAYVSDCTGCTECILCTNLVKKSYCIRNEQLTKEEYERQKAMMLSGLHTIQERCWAEFLELRVKRTVKYAHILSSEDCTGDYIQGSKACVHCFDTWDSQDLADVVLASQAKDCLLSGCITGELCYDVQAGVGAYNCRHSYSVFDSSDIEYSDMVFQSKNLFGCVCMRKGEYCILNRQYAKEEYVALRQKLIDHMRQSGEWGKFLPQECSCFAYNESTAASYFPLTKPQVAAEGFSWFDAKREALNVTKTIPAQVLPDSIDDVPDDILQWAIECSVSGQPFKVVKQELDMYRSLRLPIPRLHPDERYKRRQALRNPLALHSRKCANCHRSIATSYAPERPEKVVCESCYLKEVY